MVRVREPGSGGRRYVKIAVGSRDAEDGFWCRVPEHSGAAQIGVGDQVSFVPGITDCEWIAKDVRLVDAAGKEEPAEAGYTGRGIILFFPNALRTNGFIGNCYVSQNYAKMENAGLPRGNVMFSQEQIDFGFKPGNIYVVSYTCAKEPGEVVQEAVSVTLEKMYPYADYAKVWIDGNGEVKMLPVSVFYAKKFVGQDVEVLLSNGERTAGKAEGIHGLKKLTLLAGDDGAEEDGCCRPAISHRCGILDPLRLTARITVPVIFPGNIGSMSTISQMPVRHRSWFWGSGFHLRLSRL